MIGQAKCLGVRPGHRQPQGVGFDGMHRQAARGQCERIAANAATQVRDDAKACKALGSMPRGDFTRGLFEHFAGEVHPLGLAELDAGLVAEQDRFDRGLGQRRRVALAEFLERGEEAGLGGSAAPGRRRVAAWPGSDSNSLNVASSIASPALDVWHAAC